MKVDVVIIGGGPAGIALGYLLLKKNIACVIIDRSVFPRLKLCGGLLTTKTILKMSEIFDKMSIEDLLSRTRNVSMYYKFKKVTDCVVDNSFAVIDRIELDNLLKTTYEQEGGQFLEGQVRYDINYKDNFVTLEDGEVIKYSVLVGADGANSNVRKYIDKEYYPNGFCLETVVPKDNLNIKDNKSINLYYGYVKKGYGWVFPRFDNFVVGIGKEIKRKEKIEINELKQFCKSIGLTQFQHIKGAYIPYGKYVKSPVKNNVLLIGDAAGLVDPITGEGLYFALVSACNAYEVIYNHIRFSKSLNQYNNSIKSIQNLIDDNCRIKKFFFNKVVQGLGFKLGRNHHGFVKFICDNSILTTNSTFRKATSDYWKIKTTNKK